MKKLILTAIKMFQYGKLTRKMNSFSFWTNTLKCLCIGCKLVLVSGIVTLITGAAGQLVWEDLQWGNSSQELFPGHDGAGFERLSCRDDLSLDSHLWLIGLRFHSRAETIHYWVWSCVTKRPGHLAVACGVPTIDTNPVKDQFSPAVV